LSGFRPDMCEGAWQPPARWGQPFNRLLPNGSPTRIPARPILRAALCRAGQGIFKRPQPLSYRWSAAAESGTSCPARIQALREFFRPPSRRAPRFFRCTVLLQQLLAEDGDGCRAEVHTWSGKYDYTRWQAFDLKRQTNGLSSAGPIAPTSRWRSP
jgi:hypothetical protein